MIVVAGEALVDLIPGGADFDELTINPGGGPFNTARWLACLGQPVEFLGALAADPLGRQLRQALAHAGVDLDLVVETGLPTTLALAQLDDAGGAQYSFYADGTSVRGLTVAAVSDGLSSVPSLTALHFGGVALVLAPSSEALEHAAAVARARGALVLLDPNIRAGLIADRNSYIQRFERVLCCTDVVKLSVEDLEWLAPGVDPDEAVSGLLAAGPAVVLLTEGGEGASVHFAEGAAPVVRLTAERVDVVDTIGAGDAFGAGFLAHLLRSPGRGDVSAVPAPHPPAGRLPADSSPFIDPPLRRADPAEPAGRFPADSSPFIDPPLRRADPAEPAGRLPADSSPFIDPPKSSAPSDPRGALQDRGAVLEAARFATRIAGIACVQRGAKPSASLQPLDILDPPATSPQHPA